jgi:hypothetical protein
MTTIFSRINLCAVLTLVAFLGLNALPVAAANSLEPVYINVGLLPDSGSGAISFRDYDFSADAYLKCVVVKIDGAEESSLPLAATSLATIRVYVSAMQKKDYKAFLDSCYPEKEFHKERAEQKDKYRQYFDFWSSRFKDGLPIVLSQALLYGDSVFYLLLQKDAAAPGGLHHVEVVETKPCGLTEWRCTVGEFAPVKNSIIAAFFGTATRAPCQKLDGLEKYVEIPVVETKDKKTDVALLLPGNQTGANAEAISTGCAIANQFADLMTKIGEKGKLEEEDKEKMKGLCSQNSFEMVMLNSKTLESPVLSKDPGNFRGLWLSLAGLYSVGKGKCIAIPAAYSTTLWVMDDAKVIRQIMLRKEKGRFVICGVGAESQDMADFLSDIHISERASAYITSCGIACNP